MFFVNMGLHRQSQWQTVYFQAFFLGCTTRGAMAHRPRRSKARFGGALIGFHNQGAGLAVAGHVYVQEQFAVCL